MQQGKPIAQTYAEYAAAPNEYATIERIPPALVVRLPGFVDFGIDGDTLVEAVRKAGPEKGPATPGWHEVMIEYGHQAMQRGEIAEQNSDSAQAEWDFLEASFWYFFARFPHIFNEGGEKAYQLHTAAYLRASKHFSHSTEVLDISFEGKKGRAFLRFPDNITTIVPVVMISGGVDVWKSDIEIHSLSEAFLNAGIATLLIDAPGTGEAPVNASLTAHNWYLSALAVLKGHPKINESAMGVYGLSFGGYWATKLAFAAPWLAGVVNTGGPIHFTFQAEWLEKLPFGLKMSLARMCGLDPTKGQEAMVQVLEKCSLYKQGFLPTTRQAPLLSINGEEDALVPIKELDFLKDQGVKQDTLIFSNDRHVASRNWRLHEEFSAKWLTKKLSVM